MVAQYFKDQKGINVIKIIRDVVMKYKHPNETLSDNGTQSRNLIGELGSTYSRLPERLGRKPISTTHYHLEMKKIKRWFSTI
ncbi:MAG: hypothetical protein R6U96_19250 [Promethearchaeia archaeon]